MAGERESEAEPMDDDLVRRLRELDWPGPPPGLKERSLEEFQRRLDEQDEAAASRRTAASGR